MIYRYGCATIELTYLHLINNFWLRRDFFIKRDGFIVDNPNVGPTLAEKMWAPGNSRPFLNLVEELTGAPLSGTAWVSELGTPLEQLIAEERCAYDAAAATSPPSNVSVDLDMRVRLVDGDDVIADSAEEGSFVATCRKFESYIQDRYKK